MRRDKSKKVKLINITKENVNRWKKYKRISQKDNYATVQKFGVLVLK